MKLNLYFLMLSLFFLNFCSSSRNKIDFHPIVNQSTRNIPFGIILLNNDSYKIGLEEKSYTYVFTNYDFKIEDQLFIITPKEIEHYDWSDQSIIINKSASDSIMGIFKNLEVNQEIHSFNSLLQQAGEYGNKAECALQKRPFLVYFNNNFQYAGIFLNSTSNRKYDFPVARVFYDNGKIKIVILPTHLPFVEADPIDENGNFREVHIFNRASEGGNEVAKSIALSVINTSKNEVNEHFRKLIRNPNIGEIFLNDK